MCVYSSKNFVIEKSGKNYKQISTYYYTLDLDDIPKKIGESKIEEGIM